MISPIEEAYNTYVDLVEESGLDDDIMCDLISELSKSEIEDITIPICEINEYFSELRGVHTEKYDDPIPTEPNATSKEIVIACDDDGRAMILDGNHRYNTFKDRMVPVRVAVMRIEEIPIEIWDSLYKKCD